MIRQVFFNFILCIIILLWKLVCLVFVNHMNTLPLSLLNMDHFFSYNCCSWCGNMKSSDLGGFTWFPNLNTVQVNCEVIHWGIEPETLLPIHCIHYFRPSHTNSSNEKTQQMHYILQSILLSRDLLWGIHVGAESTISVDGALPVLARALVKTALGHSCLMCVFWRMGRIWYLKCIWRH